MDEILTKYRKQFFLALGGLFLVIISLLSFRLNAQQEPAIEIISSEASEENIFVYLEGAVEKPGVYEVTAENRLNDLLIRAGGLAATADRSWVSQNLNLAQKLIDGSKIYIPRQNETSQDSNENNLTEDIAGKININRASSSQLEVLWGIGEKRAEDIIKNRPYQSVDELLIKKVIPQNIFEKIRDEISVY